MNQPVSGFGNYTSGFNKEPDPYAFLGNSMPSSKSFFGDEFTTLMNDMDLYKKGGILADFDQTNPAVDGANPQSNGFKFMDNDFFKMLMGGKNENGDVSNGILPVGLQIGQGILGYMQGQDQLNIMKDYAKMAQQKHDFDMGMLKDERAFINSSRDSADGVFGNQQRQV